MKAAPTVHVAPWITPFRRLAFSCFLLALLVAAPGFLGLRNTEHGNWVPGVLLFSATLSSIASLLPTIPWQNVVMISLMIGTLGGLAHGIGETLGLPFGSFNHQETFPSRLFKFFSWPMSLLWIIATINGRGVARLMLGPWRQSQFHGIHLMALTCLLTVAFDLGLEPLARSEQYWAWHVSTAPAWYPAPWTNSLAWGALSILMSLVITPWIIDKRRAEPNPDILPLLNWTALMLLFAASAIDHQQGRVTIFLLLIAISVNVRTWRVRRRSCQTTDRAWRP